MTESPVDLSIRLDAETYRRIQRLTEMLGTAPEAWIADLAGFAVGMPSERLRQQLSDRVARLDAPVASWPTMEEAMMRRATGRE